MKTFLNILLSVPASFPHDEIVNGSYADAWIALLTFFVFIMVIYIALSSGKRRNSKSGKTGKFNHKHMILQ